MSVCVKLPISLLFLYHYLCVYVYVCFLTAPLGFLARRAGRLRSLQHVISAGCGVVALYWFFGEVLVYLLVLALLSYPLLRLTRLKCTAWSGKALACIAVVYLLTWSVCIEMRLLVT